MGDLLQLARADQPQSRVVIDLAQIATQRVDTWTALAELSEVTLVLEGAGAPMFATAAPGAVEQILDNTLDNALNVSPAGSRIVVLVGGTAERCSLTVRDQGPGLSDEDKDRATRRFWRKTGATPGTGLGLAIAQALARACGGSLRLADAPGHGLDVVLDLPRSETA